MNLFNCFMVTFLITWTSACSDINEWQLGMNLHPSDGHIMGYCTGWHTDDFIGSDDTAFFRDYKNRYVWKQPANYIAIVRHQNGVADAVKTWRFKHPGLSLLERFSDQDPGRRIETLGGELQNTVLPNAQFLDDDPIFSLDGDLAFNWRYANNGCRIALNSSNLSPADSDDDNTHGFGNHFAVNPKSCQAEGNQDLWSHEMSVIQDCPTPSCTTVKTVGTDHGTGASLTSGPLYGQYAIFVSQFSKNFPLIGRGKTLERVVNAYA